MIIGLLLVFLLLPFIAIISFFVLFAGSFFGLLGALFSKIGSKEKTDEPPPATVAKKQEVFPIYFPSDLIRVDQMKGRQFEYWCADLLKSLGYDNVWVTKGSGDQGVDILAEKDGLRYAIQCKRYSSNLGNKPVQEVFAGMIVYNCSAGMVMTNQYFTSGAITLAKKTGVRLVNRKGLMEMMEDANKREGMLVEVDTNRKRQDKDKAEMWPHCDDVDIDTAYFDEMPSVDRTEDMKEFISAYPLEPNEDPRNLPVEQIITIISEPFERKDYAEHFATAITKHCYSIAKVIEDSGNYFVKIRSHVYSIMSNYFEHCNDFEDCDDEAAVYKFANWS